MSWISKLKLVVDNSDKLKEAVDKSKQALGENAGKINSVIDSVASTADSRTGGKYSERIDKLNASAKGGVGNLASDPSATGTPDTTTPHEATPTPVTPTPVTPTAGVAPEPELPDAEVVED